MPIYGSFSDAAVVVVVPVVLTRPGKFWRRYCYPFPVTGLVGSVRTKGQLTAGRGRSREATLPGQPFSRGKEFRFLRCLEAGEVGRGQPAHIPVNLSMERH